MGQEPPTDKPPTLAARLRRPLTFGALLDETIRIFRRCWLTFTALSTLALVPSGVLLVAAQALGPSTRLNAPDVLDSARNFRPEFAATVFGEGILMGLVNSLFLLLWAAAVTLMTADLLAGQRSSVGQVYRRAFGRFLPTLGAGALVFLGVILLGLLSFVLIVVTLGPVGMLVGSIALLVWWLNPGARRRWLKWLIILTSPFGLAFYYAMRWVLFTPAVVLEGRGPLAGLHRSAGLVQGQWFRVAGVVTLVGIIVGILILLPASLLTLILTLVLRHLLGPASAGLTNLGDVVGQILFGPIAYIAYALLFMDLRNRREGADLAERVDVLESRAAFA